MAVGGVSGRVLVHGWTPLDESIEINELSMDAIEVVCIAGFGAVNIPVLFTGGGSGIALLKSS
jgi:hypothetical protein